MNYIQLWDTVSISISEFPAGMEWWTPAPPWPWNKIKPVEEHENVDVFVSMTLKMHVKYICMLEY